MSWPNPSTTRWSANARRPTTCDLRRLPVHRLALHGLALAGAPFSWQWTRDGERVAWIDARVMRDEAGADLMLNYRLNGEPMRDCIRLEWTPCRFGGARWFALCPKTGRRVAFLYLGLAGALSRPAYGLAFDSQRESPLDRSLRRRDKALARMKSDSPLKLARPKGMHRRTYGRALFAVMAEEDRFYEALKVRLGVAL
jgi:hypothetical protein